VIGESSDERRVTGGVSRSSNLKRARGGTATGNGSLKRGARRETGMFSSLSKKKPL